MVIGKVTRGFQDSPIRRSQLTRQGNPSLRLFQDW